MASFVLEEPVWVDFINGTTPPEALSPIAPGPSTSRYVLVFAFLLSIPFIVNYFIIWVIFQYTHLVKQIGKVPPTLPHLVPLLGSTLSFVWGGTSFGKYATYVDALPSHHDQSLSMLLTEF